MTKITGTNSFIDVETDGKTVRIYGERTVSGFVCNKNSIQNWTKPEGVPVTEAEKEFIIVCIMLFRNADFLRSRSDARI